MVDRPQIQLGNVSARLDLDRLDAGVRESLLEWFDDYCSFEVPTWVQRRSGGRRRPTRKVETVRLFNRQTGKFPKGLVRKLLVAAREDALDALEAGEWELGPLAYLQVHDHRQPPCAPAPMERWPELAPWLSSVTRDRDYRFQTDAVAAVVRETSGILSVPTGGGKTEIAIGCERVIPCRWLFLVPGKDLLHQAAGRYERLTGLEAGVIGDGVWKVPEDGRFTVATFQTLSRALKVRAAPALELLQSWAQGLVVDECHTLPADSFYAVAAAARAAYYRVGISATPLDRTDRRSVFAIAALGRIIYRIAVPELAARGVISLPTIHVVPCRQEFERATWKGSYGAGVVRSTARNQLVVEIVRRADRPGLVFVKEVAHGKEMAKRLGRAGLRVEFVWGEKDTAVRQRAIKRLERGDLDFLVSNVIFQQGVDIPCLRSVVNAAAMASAIAAIQRVGRGTRRDGNKDTVQVWDIADTGNKTLAKWTRERLRAYEKAGFPVVHEIAG